MSWFSLELKRAWGDPLLSMTFTGTGSVSLAIRWPTVGLLCCGVVAWLLIIDGRFQVEGDLSDFVFNVVQIGAFTKCRLEGPRGKVRSEFETLVC